MDSSFGYDVGIEPVAKIDRVDVVTVYGGHVNNVLFQVRKGGKAHHSRSLYMIVKKTCRKRLTAFTRTDRRYNHASPDIISSVVWGRRLYSLVQARGVDSHNDEKSIDGTREQVEDKAQVWKVGFDMG